jgi:hypothetical protein
MSGILQGLGAFAGGVAKGATLAEGIEDMKDRRQERKERKNQKSIEDQIKQAGVDAAAQYYEPIQVQDFQQPQQQIQPSTQEQMPIGLSNIDYTTQNQPTQMVQQFADGGLVQDPKSLVNQVNQNAGLDTLQPARQQMPVAAQPQQRQQQQERPNPGIAMSRSFNAMRDKAMELGRPDMAIQYQQAGFQIRDRMFKDGLENAQRAYDTTGDIGGFVKLYDSIDDGVDVTGYERTPNGYKIKFSSNGTEGEQEYTPEQIKDLIMNFSDPAARYAAERQAQAARSKKTFETDEEIRKEKEVAKGKVQERDPYKTYVQDGTVIQEAKDKPDGWKNNYSSVSGGYIQKNADGTETFVPTSGKGSGSGSGSGKGEKDYNKEMLPVTKELTDTILGIEGMGTQDINTGKVTPTKSGNEAMVFGQRLLKQNPDMVLADVAKLAHAAATDPNATDYQVIERRDGTRYKRQVIKMGGNIYQLANTPGSDIQKPKNNLAETGSEEWRKQHKDREQPAANFSKGGDTTGRYGKGNIDLNTRDIYVYPEKENRGSYSSLESITVNFDGIEYLIPKVVGGKMLTQDQAIKHFQKTNEYLGKFKTPEEASEYAVQLERRQKSYYEKGPGKKIKDQAFNKTAAPQKNKEPGLDSVIINKTGPESFKFQEQVPSQNAMSEGEVNSARQSMGLGRKSWYERPAAKPTEVGLGNVIPKGEQIEKAESVSPWRRKSTQYSEKTKNMSAKEKLDYLADVKTNHLKQNPSERYMGLSGDEIEKEIALLKQEVKSKNQR